MDATIHYFGGRGRADQVRWLLAASDITFATNVISERSLFLKMGESGQLPFAQLPLLQIDGLEIVQSQAMVRYSQYVYITLCNLSWLLHFCRYVANRSKLTGNTIKDNVTN